MKLETTIAPRRDGKVTVEHGGNRYVFAQDEQGRLVADVEDEAAIAHILSLDNFMPADEEDFEIASQIANGTGQDVEDEADEADEEEEVPPALPIEENTPPSGRKPRKAK